MKTLIKLVLLTLWLTFCVLVWLFSAADIIFVIGKNNAPFWNFLSLFNFSCYSFHIAIAVRRIGEAWEEINLAV